MHTFMHSVPEPLHRSIQWFRQLENVSENVLTLTNDTNKKYFVGQQLRGNS